MVFSSFARAHCFISRHFHCPSRARFLIVQIRIHTAVNNIIKSNANLGWGILRIPDPRQVPMTKPRISNAIANLVLSTTTLRHSLRWSFSCIFSDISIAKAPAPARIRDINNVFGKNKVTTRRELKRKKSMKNRERTYRALPIILIRLLTFTICLNSSAGSSHSCDFLIPSLAL